jgi:hypothetical protein
MPTSLSPIPAANRQSKEKRWTTEIQLTTFGDGEDKQKGGGKKRGEPIFVPCPKLKVTLSPNYVYII